MLNGELRINESINIETELPLHESRLILFLQQFVLRARSFKFSPTEVESMICLIGLVCFMLRRIIGMVYGLDPCLT